MGLLATLDGDRQIRYAYDALGRLTKVTSNPTVGASTPTNEVTMAYNGLGQLTEESPARGGRDRFEPQGPVRLRFDGLQRPVHQGPAAHLDDLSRWLIHRLQDQGRAHNAANEVTAISNNGAALPGPLGGLVATGWAQPQHDRAGNMTVMPKPDAPTQALTASYDAWNRLVKLTNGSTTIAEYQYDGRGRRVVKVTPSETRHFYYSNDWQVLEERVGTSTTPQCRYVWGDMYVDELVRRERDTDNNGTLDESLIPQFDANYRITSLVDDSTDGVVERYRYTPYGQRTVLNVSYAVKTSGSDYAFEHGHQGLRHDPESGLVENRYRVLHPTLGRFVQRDPLEYLDGSNLYEYVRANPVNYTDSLGLQGERGGRRFRNHSDRDVQKCLGTDDCVALLNKLIHNLDVFRRRLDESLARRPFAVSNPDFMVDTQRGRRPEWQVWNGHREQLLLAAQGVARCAALYNERLKKDNCGCPDCKLDPIPEERVNELKQMVPAPIPRPSPQVNIRAIGTGAAVGGGIVVTVMVIKKCGGIAALAIPGGQVAAAVLLLTP